MTYWPEVDETNGVCSRPGIYRFTIEDAGIYVGRFSNASRVLGEYPRNIAKIMERKPYRKSRPDGFRVVHLELHRALSDGREIKVEIVENCSRDLLNERERHWIKQVPLELRLNGKRRPT